MEANLYYVWMRDTETKGEIMNEVCAPNEYWAIKAVEQRADISGYDPEKHDIFRVQFPWGKRKYE